ncbi:DMT family transporter [Lentibacillus jeotgali]|uniref:DMT family transporter n=1 Tax=Lentibacillus jeotgali TaxID=558169 RepID=UPI001FE16D9D|nr:DMT family transporter [Lentibacillus jeotgali]
MADILGGSWQVWGLLIITAIVIHGIATLIWNQYIRYAAASRASILSNLEPFIAMIMGVILLQKPITGHEMIGSIFLWAVSCSPPTSDGDRTGCNIDAAASFGSKGSRNGSLRYRMTGQSPLIMDRTHP